MSGFVLPRFSPTYVVEQKLGSGSSALVYSAYQRETNKEVVLKVISFSNPWLQREFEREIKNLSMIGKCDYVVSLLDNFVLKSQGVIVEERLRGDLLDYMGATSLSIVDVKKIFYQVCKAVEFVHERNIAHMDIKPENIFMNSVDYVKLGDFGSSTTWEPGVPTIFFSNVGTQFYCAPEVRPHQGFEADKADIWSMGILLYVLITGYWPYSGPTQEATKSCVQNGDTTLAYDLLPPDDDLLNLLQRMLSKNPDERPGITDVLANRWLLQDLDNSFISFRNSGGKENNLRDQLVAEPSQTLSKSSSEPDMVDMQSSLVIKSPRRHRSSVKYDNEADLNVSSLSDSTRGIENPPQKSKSRRKRFRTVFALFSKLKR